MFSNYLLRWVPLRRYINVDFTKVNSDPYFVLGVDWELPIEDVKKRYFELAKKYHPDLNPDNEYSKKMFVLVKEAYKKIENDKDPKLKAMRQEMEREYERAEDNEKF